MDPGAASGLGRPGSVLARSSSVMSVASPASPTKRLRPPGSGSSPVWRSQSCMSDLDQVAETDISQVEHSTKAGKEISQRFHNQKAPSSAFTFKNLLRHYGEQTYKQININTVSRHEFGR